MAFFISTFPKTLFLKTKIRTSNKNVDNKRIFFCNIFFENTNENAPREDAIKDIENYQKFLPESFFLDETAPFFASLLWLQKIGRTDLINNSISKEKMSEIFKKSTHSSREDPIFNIQKKIQKKKNMKSILPLTIGKTKEDKFILFDNKIVKKNKSFSLSNENFYLKKNQKNEIYFSFSFSEINLMSYEIINRLLFSIFFLILAISSNYFDSF